MKFFNAATFILVIALAGAGQADNISDLKAKLSSKMADLKTNFNAKVQNIAGVEGSGDLSAAVLPSDLTNFLSGLDQSQTFQLSALPAIAQQLAAQVGAGNVTAEAVQAKAASFFTPDVLAKIKEGIAKVKNYEDKVSQNVKDLFTSVIKQGFAAFAGKQFDEDARAKLTCQFVVKYVALAPEDIASIVSAAPNAALFINDEEINTVLKSIKDDDTCTPDFLKTQSETIKARVLAIKAVDTTEAPAV
uniref:DUF148 domain-containing protein n=1 Tax=Rhabditophanes sp. KR3021 TaxID=114890 RepID=A0AC35TYT5_9BILA